MNLLLDTHVLLVAQHQARYADHRALRHVMKVVAEDETRHAELGWAVAAWSEARLTPSERECVHAARATAVRELRAAMSVDVDPTLIEAAGLPGRRAVVAMLDVVEAGLWSVAAA